MNEWEAELDSEIRRSAGDGGSVMGVVELVMESIESIVRNADVPFSRASTSQSGPIVIPRRSWTAFPSWL